MLRGARPRPVLPWPTVKGRKEVGGGSLLIVSGSPLCWRGLAVKYWPPWQPRSTVLSDGECGAAGSVLNTS